MNEYTLKRVSAKYASKLALDPNLPFDKKFLAWRYSLYKNIQDRTYEKLKFDLQIRKLKKVLDKWLGDKWDVYTEPVYLGTDSNEAIVYHYIIWVYEDITIVDNNGNSLYIPNIFVRLNVTSTSIAFARRYYTSAQYYDRYFHSHIDAPKNMFEWTSKICYGDVKDYMLRSKTLDLDIYGTALLSLLPNFLTSESTNTNPYKMLSSINSRIGKYVTRSIDPVIIAIKEYADLDIKVSNVFGDIQMKVEQDEKLENYLLEKLGQEVAVYRIKSGNYTQLYFSNDTIYTDSPPITIRDKSYRAMIMADDKNIEYKTGIDYTLVSRAITELNKRINTYAEIKQERSSQNDYGILAED